MTRIWNRLTGRECLHERSVVVDSVGVRRSVCEDCGHLSFRMERNKPADTSSDEKTRLPEAAGF